MKSSETNTWPELAIGLYDKLTGRGAKITYEMDDLRVAVPAGTSDAAPRAEWVVNGTVRISTSDQTANA